MRAIALAEAIEVLEEDLDLEFEAVAARVEQDSDVVRTQLTEAGHIPALKVDIAKRKSLDWLTESVTITDEAGNSITFSDLAASDEDDGDTVVDTPASEEDESE